MCGPHTSQSSSAASHPTYGPSQLDLASGGFFGSIHCHHHLPKQKRLNSSSIILSRMVSPVMSPSSSQALRRSVATKSTGMPMSMEERACSTSAFACSMRLMWRTLLIMALLSCFTRPPQTSSCTHLERTAEPSPSLALMRSIAVKVPCSLIFSSVTTYATSDLLRSTMVFKPLTEVKISISSGVNGVDPSITQSTISALLI